MKRLVSYFLFALFLLFVGVSVNQLDTNLKQKAQTSYARASETQSAPQFYYRISTISFVEFAELLTQVQVVPSNTIVLQSSKLNYYRLVRFNRNSHLVFQTNFLDFQSVRELLQFKGYYLYHLCKLLI